MATGRPSKLTEELQKEICEWIEKGNTFERASRLSGITDRVFFLWKAKGKKTKSGKYFHFFQAVKRAEDKYKAWNLAIIMKAAQEGAWQAAAWGLERKYPEEFGRRERFIVEMNTKIDEFKESFDRV